MWNKFLQGSEVMGKDMGVKKLYQDILSKKKSS